MFPINTHNLNFELSFFPQNSLSYFSVQLYVFLLHSLLDGHHQLFLFKKHISTIKSLSTVVMKNTDHQEDGRSKKSLLAFGSEFDHT